MKCEQAREQLPDFLARRLDLDAHRELEAHLGGCPWCREEAEMWARLEALPEEPPTPALRARFDAMLAAYREGMEHTGPAGPRHWWFRPPAWQFSTAALFLLAGIAVGRLLIPSGQSDRGELARLRDEVHNTRELVTLSLLQQQSASQRLRGINWSYRVDHPDRDVLAALLETLNYDTSVDVRLAAVDALRRFSGDAAVRRGLADALGTQPSPLVQIAVIDGLVEMREREAAPALAKLARDREANESVRQRAGWAIEQLK